MSSLYGNLRMDINFFFATKKNEEQQEGRRRDKYTVH
jgi:hypothetical protein